MESISIHHGTGVLDTATVTDTVHSGSMTVHKGISKAGNVFITIEVQSSKTIVVTTLSSGSAVLIDAI